MKYSLALIFGLFLFACANDGSEDNSTEIDSNEAEPEEVDFSDIDEYDEDVKYTYVFPEATADDACLPYPRENFLQLIENNNLPDLGDDAGFLYTYVVAHFDSLGPKEHKEFKIESEWDEYKYDWVQHFSDGLSYGEVFYGEGGPTGTIYTSCSDKEAVYSTINALVNYTLEPADPWPSGEWNDSKDYFAPFEGVGCFYHLVKDDSTGYYNVENYCGC